MIRQKGLVEIDIKWQLALLGSVINLRQIHSDGSLPLGWQCRGMLNHLVACVQAEVKQRISQRSFIIEEDKVSSGNSENRFICGLVVTQDGTTANWIDCPRRRNHCVPWWPTTLAAWGLKKYHYMVHVQAHEFTEVWTNCIHPMCSLASPYKLKDL